MLQTIFVKRVKEELEDRQLTPRQFAQLTGAPKERTIYDVLNRGAVPGLTVVHQCAVALNMPATALLVDKPRSQELTTGKVRQLREPPTPVFAPQQSNRTNGKTTVRNKSRA